MQLYTLSEDLKIMARLEAIVRAKTKLREAAVAITQNGLSIPEIILATCDPLEANN